MGRIYYTGLFNPAIHPNSNNKHKYLIAAFHHFKRTITELPLLRIEYLYIAIHSQTARYIFLLFKYIFRNSYLLVAILLSLYVW
jgi:hypothetical protein